MMKSLFLTTTWIVLGLSVFASGCGKEAKSSKSKPDRVTPPIQNRLLELIKRQEVACDPNQACPNYLAKVVVIDDNKLKFCTGFLVKADVVATSTSCIPSFLRRNGQDCSKDIYFNFPRTSNRDPEQVGCKSVLQVSQLEGTDPVLWRDDIAFLKINKQLTYRKQASIVREGLFNNKIYTAWFVDQVDDRTAFIRREYCDALHETYVNPLVKTESSPNMVLGSCVFKTGNSGAPIIDNRGKVRAMVSTGMSSKVRDYLASTGILLKPLKPMLHGTNFACAPTVFDSDMLDQEECLKDLNYKEVDGLRNFMLSSNEVFAEMKKKLEESLESKSPYYKFGVELLNKGDTYEAFITPKCFKPISGWLLSLSSYRNAFVTTVKLPGKSFKRGLDANGRSQGLIIDGPDTKLAIQMSLKSVRSSKKSHIITWNAETDGDRRDYANMTESCGN